MAISKYSITFLDRKERLVEIAISNGQTGSTKVLTPASSPLTTSEDNDSNPLLPIRATVAQIRVRCTHADIIPIDNNLQWSVTIKRANAIVWRGYLRAELPDMDFSPIPDEITYTADDILGTLKYAQATLGTSRQTFTSLLTQTYTLIDNSMPVLAKGDSPIATLSALYAEAYNWKKQVEDANGHKTWENEMQDVLESDILGFLGMTARYYNNHLYLGSLFASRYYNGSTLVIPTTVDGEAFQWRGFHTLSWEQGRGLIELEAVGEQIGSPDMPNFGDDNSQVVYCGYAKPQVSEAASQGGYNCFLRVMSPVSGWEVSNEGNTDNLWGMLGGYVADYDIWDTDSSQAKSNYSFTRAAFFSGRRYATDGTQEDMPTFHIADRTSESDVTARCNAAFYAWLNTQSPYICLKSDGPIYTKDGGFTLKVTPKVVNSTLVTTSGKRYRRVTDFADLGDRTFGGIYRLQYGDKYWNGLAWQPEPCYFIEGHDSILQKGLSMMFQGEGMAMPVSGVMSGQVTLGFYGSYAFRSGYEEIEQSYTEYFAYWEPVNYNTSPGYNWFKFETFELKYNRPLDLFAVKKQDSRTLSYRAERLPESNAENIDLHLCSSGDIADNWGWVYLASGEKLTTLHWPKAREDMMPEQMVLRRYALARARIERMATLTIDCEIADLPFQRIALDGRTWYPLCLKTNWQECTSELTLLDITDIMALLPSVGDDEEGTGYTRVLNISSRNAQTTFRQSAAIDEALTITWACYGMSGTSVIPAGGTSITVNTGGDIQEERDFDNLSVSTPSGKYTIMLTFNGKVN